MQKLKFRFSGSHVDAIHTAGSLKLVFLDLTSQCNLRCRYCFNHHKLGVSARHLDVSLIESVLVSPIASTVESWFLSGGEPLCHPQLDDVLELFRNYGRRPKIATNGVLLTPDVVDRWVAQGVQSVQFSLDTLDPVTFDRLNAGSPAALQALLDNMANAVASPLRIVASSVLTKANAHEIADIMRCCMDLGVDSYTLYPDVPARGAGRELALPIPEQMALFHRLFEAYVQMSPTRLVDLSIPCFQFSEVYARWQDRLNMRLHACGAGHFNLKVTSEGRVSVCICQDAPDFIVGNLHEQTIDDIWSSPPIERFRTVWLEIPECRECEIRTTCRGGCRSEAYACGSRGILSSDPHCDILMKNALHRA